VQVDVRLGRAVEQEGPAGPPVRVGAQLGGAGGDLRPDPVAPQPPGHGPQYRRRGIDAPRARLARTHSATRRGGERDSPAPRPRLAEAPRVALWVCASRGLGAGQRGVSTTTTGWAPNRLTGSTRWTSSPAGGRGSGSRATIRPPGASTRRASRHSASGAAASRPRGATWRAHGGFTAIRSTLPSGSGSAPASATAQATPVPRPFPTAAATAAGSASHPIASAPWP